SGLTPILTPVWRSRRMHVHLLDVTVYQDSGWTWKTERTPNPTLEDIETAVRRLDRFEYPFLHLYEDANAADDDPPALTVMGGQGEYTMFSGFNGDELFYFDPSRTDEEIEVWQSDQGFSCAAKNCCGSLDAVVGITRYFCEHGELDPSAAWQEL